MSTGWGADRQDSLRPHAGRDCTQPQERKKPCLVPPQGVELGERAPAAAWTQGTGRKSHGSGNKVETEKRLDPAQSAIVSSLQNTVFFLESEV